ncbi:hypothetical protein Mkiyose1665_21690 [Mycobacterium kiyosense]|uniref:Uncharacterized protein n=2 Tax=Mycobacteriaceae TaxID=1762 RepID=A0A9P3Q5R1_9MYCO|nr:hypothetical protein MKCMC460_10320 [Mycobacterium sp. 20KCMC460]GLB85937.1 hypothetical protein SRL2020028_51930 [Mycobacterium kiyosense]GLB88673.1 hypothetical protein SRL2020130_14900 [Mycobacterium kiyosense]GLB95057.1 hypothetical protein SRL2020226_18330 [Mycobacterium kiyosense]GLC01840.1 hypothetical protein SRL2020400_24310 [Mycobacterium kiyosense]
MKLSGTSHETPNYLPMRYLAAATVLAGLVGLAAGTVGTARADTTMSGHYTWTTTSPQGSTSSGDFYFTPCGDGCASAALTAGGPSVGQAKLVNGQWVMNGTWPQRCSDGSTTGLPYVDTWDPVTLAGTETITFTSTACGATVGSQQVSKLQYTQAGS